MAPSVAEPFPISCIGGRYLLFDIETVSHARREHNVCGVLIGTLPNLSQQNVFLGLPVELMPEEARVLVEKGAAFIVDDVAVHRQGFMEMSREDRLAYLRDMDQMGSEYALAQKQKMEERAKEALKKKGIVPDRSRKTQTTAGGPKSATAEASSSTNATATENDDASLFDAAPKSQPPVSSTAAKTKLDPHYVTPATSYPPLPVPSADSALSLPEVPRSYPLFKYMHARGYFSTPGLRFGCQYTIYPGDPLRFHSHFLGTGLDWDEEFDLLDVVGGGRLGTGVKKSYLLGGEDPAKKGGDAEALRPFSVEWAGL